MSGSRALAAAFVVSMAAAAWPGAAVAQGATAYVAAGGCSDSSSAPTNPATPVCSIGRAIAAAGSGGRVILVAGSYPELSVGGTRSAYVTVSAQPGAAVTVQGITVPRNASNVRIEGMTITDGIDIWDGANNIVIEGNHISSGGNGITFNAESSKPNSPGSVNDPPISNVVIRNNAFDNIGTDVIRPANFNGLLIEGNDITGIAEDGDHSDILQSVWGGDHLTFRNNYVHDYEGQGFFLKDGQVTDVTVENNVFINNSGTYTVNVYDTIGFRMLNNTIWDNSLGVRLRSVQNGQVYNNLIESMNHEGSQTYGAIAQDYNVIAGGSWTQRGPHDTRSRPAFVNAAGRDYRLAAGSVGIDAGTSDNAPPTDKACRPRYDVPGVANTGAGSPAFYDMGALEHGPASTPADTGAPWGTGCAGSRPPGTGGGPAGPVGGGCPCPAGGRPFASIRRAHLNRGQLVLRLRVRNTCQLRVAGRARWKGGGEARRARLKVMKRAIQRPQATVTLNRKLARRARVALFNGRKVRLRLTIRLTGCNGEQRVLQRRVRLRR